MKNIPMLLIMISVSVMAEHQPVKTPRQEMHFQHARVNAELPKATEEEHDAYSKFISGLADIQLAVASVNGMVCDFCSRGIEKAFLRDSEVLKVDADLSQGRVLIAYHKDKKIDLVGVRNEILAKGQNVTELKVVTLKSSPHANES